MILKVQYRNLCSPVGVHIDHTGHDGFALHIDDGGCCRNVQGAVLADCLYTVTIYQDVAAADDLGAFHGNNTGALQHYSAAGRMAGLLHQCVNFVYCTRIDGLTIKRIACRP